MSSKGTKSDKKRGILKVKIHTILLRDLKAKQAKTLQMLQDVIWY